MSEGFLFMEWNYNIMKKKEQKTNIQKNKDYINRVFYKDSRNMEEIPNNSIQLIVTSPPYFNIKDYSKDGWQRTQHSQRTQGQIGDLANYKNYIDEMLKIWKECERILKPNGKLVVNTPLMPIFKKKLNSHYNRHIFDINSDIQQSILDNTELFLLDIFILE